MSKNYYTLPCIFGFPNMTFEDMDDIRKLVNDLGRPQRAMDIADGTLILKRDYFHRTKKYVMDAFRGLVD